MRDIVVNVDGSSLHNGQPYAVAGWGAVISLPNVRAEACGQLCSFCNPKQSNSRAEIRAVQFAQSLLLEVVKMGHPLHLNPDGSRCRRTAPHSHHTWNDGRPFTQRNHDFLVRTDSMYVVNGIYGDINVKAHASVWDQVFSIDSDIESNGSAVEYRHVYGHRGDKKNERADSLARLAAANHGFCMYKCCTCEVFFTDSDGLACHLKEDHMYRDLADEMEQIYDFHEHKGMYHCALCGRVCNQLYSMYQHNTAKH